MLLTNYNKKKILQNFFMTFKQTRWSTYQTSTHEIIYSDQTHKSKVMKYVIYKNLDIWFEYREPKTKTDKSKLYFLN